jgi:hypothetical protein
LICLCTVVIAYLIWYQALCVDGSTFLIEIAKPSVRDVSQHHLLILMKCLVSFFVLLCFDISFLHIAARYLLGRRQDFFVWFGSSIFVCYENASVLGIFYMKRNDEVYADNSANIDYLARHASTI